MGYVHARAVEQGEPGKRYIVSGENITVTDVGKVLTEVSGIPMKHNPGPRALGMVLGAMYEAVSAVTRKPPLFTRAGVADFVERYAVYDASPTYTTFAYEPRSIHEMLSATVAWLLEIDAVSAETAEKIRAHQG